MDKKAVAARVRRWLSVTKHFVFTYRRVFGLVALYFSVFLFVSTLMLLLLTRPESDVRVPNVIGRKYTSVHNTLTRDGLAPVLKFRDVHDVEDGVILSQFPAPGVVKPEGSRLNLTVSRNILMVEVPTLVGKELPLARNKLRNLHIGERTVALGVGAVSYVPSETTPANVVISQQPAAGERVTQERKVNLLVSSGKTGEGAVMPEVSGQSVDLCYNLLRSKGVFVVQELVPTALREQSGVILSQTPAAGLALAEGSEVRLQVGAYPSSERYYRGYDEVDYAIPQDEEPGIYQVLVSDDSGERECYAAQVGPGKHIRFVFYREGNAQVRILREKVPVKMITLNVDSFE